MEITERLSTTIYNLKMKTIHRNKVVEFWLDGFNGEETEADMKKAFAHIVKIYDGILNEDPNWHYFYEGYYSLIRCSLKYRDKVKKYFEDNYIDYRYRGIWQEGTYVTVKYYEIYKQMFHTFSILNVEMYKNGDGDKLFLAADRVCHCYHNHALYLVNADGKLKNYRDRGNDIVKWESDNMAALTGERCFYAGRYQGQREMKKMRDIADAAKKEAGDGDIQKNS